MALFSCVIVVFQFETFAQVLFQFGLISESSKATVSTIDTIISPTNPKVIQEIAEVKNIANSFEGTR